MNISRRDLSDLCVVVIYDFARYVGGINPVAMRPAAKLAEAGAAVYYCAAESNYKPPSGVEYVSLSSVGDSSSAMYKRVLSSIINIPAGYRLFQLLKKLDKEKTVVHFHGWGMALSSLVVLVAKMMGFSTVYTLHDYSVFCPTGNYFNNKKKQDCLLKPMASKCLISNCDKYPIWYKPLRISRKLVDNHVAKVRHSIDRYIAVSEVVKQFSCANGVPINKVDVLRNPVQSFISAGRSGNSAMHYDLVYIGRIEEEKGVRLLCEVCAEGGFELDVIGDGSQLSRLKLEFKSNVNIRFHGWVASDEVGGIIEVSKCLVMPSEWREPSGVVVDEALSYGRPVIVPTETGGEEKVPPQFCYSKGDKPSLANVITRVLSDLGEAEVLARDSANRIVSYDEYADQLVEVYMRCLGCK
jgi:glycosyltransferase involved in cell wall biosynthesis